MRNRRFWQLGWVALSYGLLGCGSTDVPSQSPQRIAQPAVPEPSVLITTRHYLRLLTQASLPPVDSLTHYRGLVAQPDVLPGRLLLRLPTYTVIVQPDSLYPQVTLEPAARTELYNPLATAAPAEKPNKKATVQVVLTARKTNPTLAISLPELVASFGQWQGDDYAPVEEPLEPDMHTTEIAYRNAKTGRRGQLAVRLRNAPQAATNAVHYIQLTRTRN